MSTGADKERDATPAKPGDHEHDAEPVATPGAIADRAKAAAELGTEDESQDDDFDPDDDIAETDAGRSRPPPLAMRGGGQEVPAVLVRFRVPGQCAPCETGSLSVKPADRVVIDNEHGQSVGTVIRGVAPTVTDRPLARVLRIIDNDDLRIIERNRVREREAFLFCLERIKARNLPMKLVSVELAHSGTRAVFYFSSAARVDFRALVKDLARRFHTRIEMRQIGVRDGARHAGGNGLCGRELCCATWLGAFKPISIRMAKDQNLALNHQKLSGLCGRLRCCLEYEEETYQSLRKGLPKVGKRVVTPQGEGRVKDVDVLRRRVRVQLNEGGYGQYEANEVTRPVDTQQQQPQQHAQPQPPARPLSPPVTSGSGAEASAPQPGAGDSDATGQALRSGKRRRRRRGRRGRPGGSGAAPVGGSPPPSPMGKV
ncbi:MAG: hypothetical protein HY903_16990 [Deltaproteobacteria bacterium]|nr:hypothetical protein [Deltaproteobacteria bacterium]